jgi:hypothetical protein
MNRSEKIVVLNNQIEATLLDEILTEKNIPHIIRTYHDSAYDGLWQAQSGWGHLEAPSDYREEILEIYSKMA